MPEPLRSRGLLDSLIQKWLWSIFHESYESCALAMIC